MPEILLGLEIFTDWTREYKFCGAKLEGGCCCTLHEKNTIWRELWMVFDFDEFSLQVKLTKGKYILFRCIEMSWGVFIEGRWFERKQFPSDTIVRIIASIICKDLRKRKNSLLYVSATARNLSWEHVACYIRREELSFQARPLKTATRSSVCMYDKLVRCFWHIVTKQRRYTRYVFSSHYRDKLSYLLSFLVWWPVPTNEEDSR